MEVQPADPRAARRAVALTAAVALLGAAVVLMWGQRRPEVEAWILQDPARAGERLRLALALLGLAGGLPMVGFAAYFWSVAAAVRRAGRFPPPGTVVAFDTRVLTGPAARRRGQMIRALALALLALAIAVPILLWQVGRTLAR